MEEQYCETIFYASDLSVMSIYVFCAQGIRGFAGSYVVLEVHQYQLVLSVVYESQQVLVVLASFKAKP